MGAIRILYTKEMRELLRDRRVLFGAVVMPFFLVIILMSFMGMLTAAFEKPPVADVAVIGLANGKALLETEAARKSLKVREVASVAEGKALIAKKEIKLLVVFPGNVAADLAASRPLRVSVYLDTSSIPAQIALKAFHDAVDQANKAHMKALLAAQSLTERDLFPIDVQTIPVGKRRGTAGEAILSILPYLIVIFAFSGGVSQAGDAVAGEKERGTLETLLVSPAGRMQIAAGKLLHMASVCLASSLSGVLGVMALAVIGVQETRQLFSAGLHVSPIGLLAIVTTIIPLVLMFAALLVAVSAFARTPKEANTYSSGILMVVMIPAIASQFIGYTDLGSKTWIGLIPVLNSATVLRQGLTGEIDWAIYGLTMAVSCALAAMAMWATVRMFRRESVLFRV